MNPYVPEDKRHMICELWKRWVGEGGNKQNGPTNALPFLPLPEIKPVSQINTAPTNSSSDFWGPHSSSFDSNGNGISSWMSWGINSPAPLLLAWNFAAYFLPPHLVGAHHRVIGLQQSINRQTCRGRESLQTATIRASVTRHLSNQLDLGIC